MQNGGRCSPNSSALDRKVAQSKFSGGKAYKLAIRNEELLVRNAPEIGSEEFDFGVEGLRHGIGGAVVIEVQDLIIMLIKSGGDDIERMEPGLLDRKWRDWRAAGCRKRGWTNPVPPAPFRGKKKPPGLSRGRGAGKRRRPTLPL